MKNYNRKNLNVKRLLELGDLDVRGIAAQNNSIAADEYFSKVEQFIKDIPSYEDIFNNLTKTALDMENVKKALTEIGYDKLNDDIDRICAAINRGDTQSAGVMTGQVFEKFNNLCSRLNTTYSERRFTVGHPKGGEAAMGSNVVSLTEALEFLDYEEEHRKLRILAVDDVSVVLNTITLTLNPYYEVFALKNSTQVEKFLMHTTPELFLLDIEMDEMNGFDLVPLIRKFEKHKDTPIIFLTGNASLNNLKDAIALGACDFITKPVDWEILLEKIQKKIVRKKAY